MRWALGFGEIVRLFMNNLDRPVNITNGPQGINMVDNIFDIINHVALRAIGNIHWTVKVIHKQTIFSPKANIMYNRQKSNSRTHDASFGASWVLLILPVMIC